MNDRRRVTVTEVPGEGNTNSPGTSTIFNRPAKTWDVTINNFTKLDIDFLTNLEAKKKVVSEEVGSNGTPHLQGRITFKRTYRLTQLKKQHPTAHWEPTKADQDFNYVMKVDSKIIIKENNCNQGKRTDLEQAKEELKNGKHMNDIVMENPLVYHQYGRTLNFIEDVCNQERGRTHTTTCDWFYGPTGTGKSHRAFQNFDPKTHFLWTNDNGWWDGYKGQEVVIMNDYRGEIPYNFLLQLIDKWPVNVRRRCRQPVPFVSRHIIITSSLKPEQIYHNREAEDKIEQLMRRINVKECTHQNRISEYMQ